MQSVSNCWNSLQVQQVSFFWFGFCFDLFLLISMESELLHIFCGTRELSFNTMGLFCRELVLHPLVFLVTISVH